MKLPYVIDNQTHRLADILKGLLAERKGRSLDVATAYFTVGGFGLVKGGLLTPGSFREQKKGISAIVWAGIKLYAATIRRHGEKRREKVSILLRCRKSSFQTDC